LDRANATSNDETLEALGHHQNRWRSGNELYWASKHPLHIGFRAQRAFRQLVKIYATFSVSNPRYKFCSSREIERELLAARGFPKKKAFAPRDFTFNRGGKGGC